jgi:hypothetical protein
MFIAVFVRGKPGTVLSCTSPPDLSVLRVVSGTSPVVQHHDTGTLVPVRKN